MISFVVLLFAALAAASGGGNHGIVELDADSLKKLVGKQFNVLLSLNEFSWKSPDNFNDVGDAFKDADNVLIAKIDVSALPADHALKAVKTPTLRFFPANAASAFVDHAGANDVASEVIEFVNFQLSPKVR